MSDGPRSLILMFPIVGHPNCRPLVFFPWCGSGVWDGARVPLSLSLCQKLVRASCLGGIELLNISRLDKYYKCHHP